MTLHRLRMCSQIFVGGQLTHSTCIFLQLTWYYITPPVHYTCTTHLQVMHMYMIKVHATVHISICTRRTHNVLHVYTLSPLTSILNDLNTFPYEVHSLWSYSSYCRGEEGTGGRRWEKDGDRGSRGDGREEYDIYMYRSACMDISSLPPILPPQPVSPSPLLSGVNTCKEMITVNRDAQLVPLLFPSPPLPLSPSPPPSNYTQICG